MLVYIYIIINKKIFLSIKYMCYIVCVIFGMWFIWSICFCWSEKDRFSIWYIWIID